MRAELRQKVQEALYWSQEIDCCPAKSVYAGRIMGLITELGIRIEDVPQDVLSALRDLDAWEECAGPVATVEGCLRRLLDPDGAT